MNVKTTQQFINQTHAKSVDLQQRIAELELVSKAIRANSLNHQEAVETSGDLFLRLLLEQQLAQQNQELAHLRAQHERFQRILNESPDWEYWLAPDASWSYCSPSCEPITGYPPESFATDANLLARIIHPLDRALVLHHLQQQQPYRVQFRIYTTNDEVRWIDQVGQPITQADGHQTGFRTINRDITTLKQNEERYRLVVDNTGQALVIMQDCRAVFVNPAGEQITGYTAAELIVMDAQTIIQIIHPDDRDLVLECMHQRLAGQDVVNRYEFRLVRNDGTICWVETINVLIDYHDRPAIQMSFIAITERKHAEQALHESEAWYRALFEKNHAIKLLIHSQTGAIIDANAAASEFYGYPLATLRTMKITDINMQPVDQVFAKMQSAYTERQQIFSFQHRLASGTIRDVEAYAGPIEIHGQPLLFSIIHDITEQKAIEHALRESQAFIERVADTIPYILYVYDLVDQCLIYINREIDPLLGYTPQHIIELGHPAIDLLLHPDDRPKVAEQRTFLPMPAMMPSAQPNFASKSEPEDGAGLTCAKPCLPVLPTVMSSRFWALPTISPSKNALPMRSVSVKNAISVP
ncbi:MAG: PAS domain S-box protein [Chloroflexaceae bacterium]|nr:PAS domain S-box protein [Chloroflexaceae bacterium]